MTNSATQAATDLVYCPGAAASVWWLQEVKMKNAFTVCVLLVLSGSILSAQWTTCSQTTLRGTYVGVHNGMTTVATAIPGGPTLPPFPFEMVSRTTFDGRGGGTGVITANFYGIVSKGTYTDFTYEVAADCTVKLKFTVQSPAIPGLFPAMVIGPNQHEGLTTLDGDEVYLVSVAATPDGQGHVDQMARTRLKRVRFTSWTQ